MVPRLAPGRWLLNPTKTVSMVPRLGNENANKKEETLMDGEKHGTVIDYYENGTKSSETPICRR